MSVDVCFSKSTFKIPKAGSPAGLALRQNLLFALNSHSFTNIAQHFQANTGMDLPKTALLAN